MLSWLKISNRANVSARDRSDIISVSYHAVPIEFRYIFIIKYINLKFKFKYLNKFKLKKEEEETLKK